MALRLLGALFLISATGRAGFIIARNLKIRHLALGKLRNLLQVLITEIDYAATVFPDMLEKTIGSLGPEIDVLCGHVLEQMNVGKVLSEAWQEGINLMQKCIPLNEDDLRPLRALSLVIGLSDRRDQLRHLKLAQEYIKQRELQAERELQQNQRLCRYFGILGGLTIVLLII